ncbi:MAG TPA: UDP-glucose 4-epimerase GalE [Chloroflexia bacterium]|nr:UDP-glucose 4-epimerase GalE [Chloroflexia bacterium]
MKVLVTGGAGYIGSHTVRELVNRQHEVIVLDTLELGHRQLAEAAGASKLIVGSTADHALLDKLFQEERPEAVIHFAAYKNAGESVEKPDKYFNNNVYGTQSLLDAMRRNNINNFIFSSSCAVYGTPENVPVSETNNPTHPESPYGESKLMVEKILKWYDVGYGLKSVSLRYFNAAGASLNGKLGEDWSVTLNLVPLVMKAALGKAASIKVFGTDYPTPDGTCIRDYIHVVDLAIAHVLSLDYLLDKKQTNVFNLGTGKGSSVKEVIDTTKHITGSDFKVENVARRPGDPVAIWADSSKAQQELGWKTQYDLETIIRTAYEWHKNHPEGV